KQEQKKISNYHEELDNEQKPNKPSRTKRETEKPKFTITETRFDQIKTYVFSETDDKTLLPNDFSEIEKTEIEKIKNSCKSWLGFLKEEQNMINEYQEKCDDYNKQISELDPKKNENEIEALNGMLSIDEDYKKT
ncbi:hypothetical protein, partial [Vaccinium witches'-broom phytoplasma]|uniref:hypothetical protein n=1 Tax=Vaccinium witches'-broom phytoplasma TaxID=85642 RepID=UPI00036841BC